LDPCQVPVDQVMVGELGVIGDVRQVLEHLLTGERDVGRDGERIHGEPESIYPVGRASPPRRQAGYAARVAARRSTIRIEWPKAGPWTVCESAGLSRSRWRQRAHRTAPLSYS